MRETGPIKVPGGCRQRPDEGPRHEQRLGLEGVMAKRRDSPYREGKRSRDWIKLKHTRTQEVVIGGWRPGKGARADTDRFPAARHPGRRLPALRRPRRHRASPTTSSPDSAPGSTGCRGSRARSSDVPREDARDAHWVTPTLVGEVEFAEATSEGRLRAPAWKGWRPDKDPKDVVREAP